MRALNRLKHGFTLIEILVVIVIIGILSAIVTTNFVGARERAQDSQKKSNLKELKTALRLYYVDYHQFPANKAGIKGLYLMGCGTTGISQCPVCATANFASGGADGCQKVYANKLPIGSSGMLTNKVKYYQCSGGDDFRLKVELANKSDPDIAESKLKCPSSTCGDTTAIELGYDAPTNLDYVLCND